LIKCLSLRHINILTPYVDSNAIKERLEEEHQAIARIQELTGCRVREIPRMTIDKDNMK